MARHTVRAFLPRDVFADQYRSLSSDADSPRILTLLVLYALPIVLGAVSWWLTWTFLSESTAVAAGTGFALVGSVLIAVAAVILQTIVAEAHRPGYATIAEKRRVQALSRINGSVLAGAVAALSTVGLLVALGSATSGTTAFRVLHSVTIAVAAFAAVSLLRVIVATHNIARAYSEVSQGRGDSAPRQKAA